MSDFVTLPIDKLIKADWNYKTDNPKVAEKLKNNIEQNGQIENIVVREISTELYEVVNGNHRIDILQSMDYKDIVCYNLGAITTEQAQRIAIELNETRFKMDSNKLKNIIIDITSNISIEGLTLTLPFSKEQLSIMLEQIPDREKKTDKKELMCPKCGGVNIEKI